MADINAERRAVIEWFKTRFSQEAGATAKTSRLPDGSLGFVFSVVNSSGVDFEDFSFQVKVGDRDTGREIGSATINAGKWNRGDKKNFKSALRVPDHVKNITFVMEPVSYEAHEADSLSEGQQQYAATDAWACVQLYKAMKQMQEEGYELVENEEMKE